MEVLTPVKDQLALLGGDPCLTHPLPHADRTQITSEDRRALDEYLSDPNAQNSFFGRDGILAEYEEELALLFGKRFCLLTNSGTNALHSAFFGVGIEPGDEVICPTYTFHATVMPLFQLGAVPVLVDVEPDTGNIDPADIERSLSNKTRAVVVTHQWGHPAELGDIRAICTNNKLPMIEDVSLAVGARLHDWVAGAVGDVACFSLGSTKMLSGGQGGALITDNVNIWERATLLGHFAARSYETVQSPYLRQFASTGYGLNYRIHPFSVAISRARLRKFDSLVKDRHARYNRLTALISATDLFDPPVTRPGATRGSWQGYCARLRGEETGLGVDTIVEALRAEGLDIQARGYHMPLHWHRIFQTRKDGLRSRVPYPGNRRVYSLTDFPKANAHVEQLVSFPLFLNEDFDLIEGYGRACAKVADHMDELRQYQREHAPMSQGQRR